MLKTEVLLNGVVLVEYLDSFNSFPSDVKGPKRITTKAGEIVQIIHKETLKSLAYIEFQEGLTSRGNHYHQEKEEVLYIIKGKLRALYKHIQNEKTEEFILESGHKVRVFPNCAHAYFPLEYTQAIEFSFEEYNPEDVYPYKLS